MVKETNRKINGGALEFQSPLGEVVKETSPEEKALLKHIKFQSPLGEVVKETSLISEEEAADLRFQSPLGEVVKETGKV